MCHTAWPWQLDLFVGFSSIMRCKRSGSSASDQYCVIASPFIRMAVAVSTLPYAPSSMATKVLRHSREPDRRHVIAVLHQHDGCADCQIQQKSPIARSKLDWRRTKTSFSVDVERSLRLNAAILWDLSARLNRHQLA